MIVRLLSADRHRENCSWGTESTPISYMGCKLLWVDFGTFLIIILRRSSIFDERCSDDVYTVVDQQPVAEDCGVR